MRRPTWILPVALCVGTAAHAESATLSVEDGTGPTPKLPAPVKSLIPTIEVAPVKPWTPAETPKPASQDLRVARFASGLDHPRWLLVLPNGDVLVAETNGPADRPEENAGIRGYLMGRM